MATLTRSFARESQRVHYDHCLLNEELHALDIALDHLHPDLNDTMALFAAKQVQMIAAQFAEELPGHFDREDREILGTVSEVSRELSQFAAGMRREHAELKALLRDFCRAIDHLENGESLSESIEAVRTLGKKLVRDLTRHVAAEEEQLRGFL